MTNVNVVVPSHDHFPEVVKDWPWKENEIKLVNLLVFSYGEQLYILSNGLWKVCIAEMQEIQIILVVFALICHALLHDKHACISFQQPVNLLDTESRHCCILDKTRRIDVVCKIWESNTEKLRVLPKLEHLIKAQHTLQLDYEYVSMSEDEVYEVFLQV